MFKQPLAATLLFCAAGAVAEERSPVRGPVLGYFVESGGIVRPVRGIPGASLQGSPLQLPEALATSLVSRKHEYVVGATVEEGEFVLIALDEVEQVARRIENARKGATRIIPSPSAATLAVYFKDTAVVQVLTGLPYDAKVAYEFEVPDAVGEIAVSADGAKVLYAVKEGDQSGLFVRDQSGEVVRLGAAGTISSVSFASSGSDAVAADAQNNEVLLVRDGSIQRLAGERDGISEPAGVAFSAKGVLVANAGTNSIALVNPEGGAVEFLACAFAPRRLSPLSEGLFQLTDSGAGTVFLLDTRPAEPAVWFVPALAGEPEGERQ